MTIDIKGQELEMRLSWRVIKRFTKKHNMKLAEFRTDTCEHMEDLVAISLQVNNPQCGVTAEDVEAWLDQDIKRLELVMDVLNEDSGSNIDEEEPASEAEGVGK